jgi:hypothetical protein
MTTKERIPDFFTGRSYDAMHFKKICGNEFNAYIDAGYNSAKIITIGEKSITVFI